MSRAFLFTNSACDYSIKLLIKSQDYIIGVDGGINTLEKIKLNPDVIIGDFDSANSNNKFLSSNIKTISHLPEKDFTDTELAVDYALKQNYSPIIIVNNMQERIDHVLGVLASLRYLYNQGVDALILSDKQLFFILNKNNILSLPTKATVSLIPLTDEVTEITTQGLYYQLKKERLTPDRARGISNIVTESHVQITYSDGLLLLCVNFQEYSEVVQLIDKM